MQWTERNKLYLLILLFLSQFTLDVSTNECLKRDSALINRERYRLLAILFIHHAISIFGYFGWIFNNRYVLVFYIFFVLAILLHWVTNNNQCAITNMLNRICEYTKYEHFHDLLHFANLKILAPFIKIFGLSAAMYKLYYN